MTQPCNIPGWGVAPWGSAPWAGGEDLIAGGPLPTHFPFNVYCAGPCGEIALLLTHPEVVISPDGDFTIDGPTGDVVITSTGTEGTTVGASLTIDDAMSLDWTFEFTINAHSLPPNFLDVTNQHVFFGVADQDGIAAGLFFSSIGVAYAATFDAAVQPLENSQTYFSGGDYYIIRIGCSHSTGNVYVYITELSYYLQYGHQLRYILPAIPYAATPETAPEGTSVYVKGTALNPAVVFLDELCLGNGLNVPNIAPVAEAGADQAIELCQIVQLDGSGSFDPEFATITYFWRLIDAPVGSIYDYPGNDGTTYPQSPATGFSNKLYSTGFAPPTPIPVSAGDVLLVGGQPYNIISTGNDISGYYVQVDGFDLPDNLTNVGYKILKQNGLNTKTLMRPTFYPDVAGLFKFDLQVFDGSLYSDPRSVTVVNVQVSALPRGVIPDLSFTWNYLSDFWKLIEDPDRIGTFWSGLAQVAATELYTLWQIEYSKSIRDIQRTFIRRWLHYDLFLREPFIQITANRFIFRGIDSSPILNSGISVTEHLDVIGIFLGTLTAPVSGAFLTPLQIAAQIQSNLRQFNKSFVVTAVPTDSTHSLIRIYAPFYFEIATTNTFSYFTNGASNQNLGGMSGVVTSPQAYNTGMSLLGLDIQANDNLAVLIQPPAGAPSYWLSVRIAGVVDAPSDPLRYQRIQTQDALPAYATNQWAVPSKALSTQLDFWDGLVENGDIAVYEVYDITTQQASYYQAPVVTATETQTNTVLLDPTNISQYLQLPSTYTVYFWGVYRQSYMPIEEQIVDIPFLQRVINTPSESEVLHRNLDFYIDKYRGSPCIRFDPAIWVNGENKYPPTPRLWAEYTYLDNRPTIEANFGIPVEFTLADLAQLPSTVDYLSAVQGLWYSYINGPTVFDLRVGTQILLGLPFAEVMGTITEIRTDFSPNTGYFLVQDSDNATIVRQYNFPVTLALEINPATGKIYAIGDTVQQFAPLVTGAIVQDWVSNPTWFQDYLSQGVFEEIQKYFTFLVRVDSAIFNLNALLFVENFLYNIKPTYTSPLFVVQLGGSDGNLTDDIQVTEHINYTGHLELFAITTDPKQTMAADYPDPGPGRLVGGVPTAWSGDLSSHIVNAADTNTDEDWPTNTFPTFSTSDQVIRTGADRQFLTPYQFITAFCSEVYAGGSPAADGVIFRTSFPAYTGPIYGLGGKYITDIPPDANALTFGTQTVTAGATLNCCEVFIEGYVPLADAAFYHIKLYKNGVLQETVTVDYSGTRNTYLFTDYNATFTPFAVSPGDLLTVTLSAPSGVQRVLWPNFFVTLGAGVALGALPAGTYTRLQAL